MKKITGLNLHVTPIDTEEGVIMEGQVPTFKRLYRLVLATGQAANADESLETFDLGLRLKAADDEIEVSDKEHNLLLSRVKQNPTRLVDHFLAQLLKKLQ